MIEMSRPIFKEKSDEIAIAIHISERGDGGEVEDGLLGWQPLVKLSVICCSFSFFPRTSFCWLTICTFS